MTDVHVVGSINRTLRGAKSPPVLLFAPCQSAECQTTKSPTDLLLR